jgi:hypothetical protein
MVEPSIFIAMFTSYIIAIYEEESPLRKFLSGVQRGGLGNAWRDKNCSSFFLLSYSLFKSSPLQPPRASHTLSLSVSALCGIKAKRPTRRGSLTLTEDVTPWAISRSCTMRFARN